MKRTRYVLSSLIVLISALLSACGSKLKIDEAAAAPPPAKIETVQDVNVIQVDRPERFQLVAAGERQEHSTLEATGVVNPDVSREVPVVSLASGRVVDIRTRLGDSVTKGQLLLRVLSDDISIAFQNYNHAKADETLARKQLERSQLLYDHGAISLNDYEIAQDTEQKAKVDLDAAAQHIRTIGADINHEDPIVDIYSPVTGTIVDQQITKDSNVKTPDNQQAGLFTIADLSHVWVICDIYENDLATIQLGETADIRLNAYPDRVFHGTISNIGSILDPSIRTAKVRLELPNPGVMRIGMFATANFYGKQSRTYATVPASAVLHLHDRDWVYLPSGQGKFRRKDVTTGRAIDGNTQIVLAGLSPGQQVVNNALALSSESEQ